MPRARPTSSSWWSRCRVVLRWCVPVSHNSFPEKPMLLFACFVSHVFFFATFASDGVVSGEHFADRPLFLSSRLLLFTLRAPLFFVFFVYHHLITRLFKHSTRCGPMWRCCRVLWVKGHRGFCVATLDSQASTERFLRRNVALLQHGRRTCTVRELREDSVLHSGTSLPCCSRMVPVLKVP